MITPLSNDHYTAHLDPVLDQVLNRAGDEVDWRKPFTELLPHRLILAPVPFVLPAQVFRCLSTPGDGTSNLFILSSLARFTDPHPIQMDWSLTSDDFEDYKKLASEPVDQVVYAPQGEWAIVINDEYAVLGSSSPVFAERIRSCAGPLSDPRRFVAYVAEAATREGFAIKDSWIIDLLKHVLDRDEAERLIASSGRN